MRGTGITPASASNHVGMTPAPCLERALHRVDLVVMGSHGYDNFDAAVRGSVAMAVASEGEVPLLLVQKEEPEVAGH